jgi:hypothetical protein
MDMERDEMVKEWMELPKGVEGLGFLMFETGWIAVAGIARLQASRLNIRNENLPEFDVLFAVARWVFLLSNGFRLVFLYCVVT